MISAHRPRVHSAVRLVASKPYTLLLVSVFGEDQRFSDFFYLFLFFVLGCFFPSPFVSLPHGMGLRVSVADG